MPSLRKEDCIDTSDKSIDVTILVLSWSFRRDTPNNAELVAHEDCVGNQLTDVGIYDLAFEKIQGTSLCQSFTTNIQSVTPGYTQSAVDCAVKFDDVATYRPFAKP